MINTFAAVKAICIYSDWSVSNLSIQKLLYISQMLHLGRHSASESDLVPLIKRQFYAWAYGPVVPQVYRKLKMFGVDEVSEIAVLRKEPDPDDSKSEYETIKYVCEQLSGAESYHLVSFTHDDDGAWQRVYNTDRPDTVITNEAIYEEYQRRYGKA